MAGASISAVPILVLFSYLPKNKLFMLLTAERSKEEH